MRWDWIGEHSLREAQDSAEALALALEDLIESIDLVDFTCTLGRI